MLDRAREIANREAQEALVPNSQCGDAHDNHVHAVVHVVRLFGDLCDGVVDFLNVLLPTQ